MPSEQWFSECRVRPTFWRPTTLAPTTRPSDVTDRVTCTEYASPSSCSRSPLGAGPSSSSNSTQTVRQAHRASRSRSVLSTQENCHRPLRTRPHACAANQLDGCLCVRFPVPIWVGPHVHTRACPFACVFDHHLQIVRPCAYPSARPRFHLRIHPLALLEGALPHQVFLFY